MTTTKRSFLSEATRPNNFVAKTVLHPGEEVFRSVCRPGCFGACPHHVTVRDGRIVQSLPAPMPDKSFNRICLRGITNLQRVYDPNRVKYPMKRVGKRGEGKFQRISWDEALDMITDNWKKTQAEYGDTAVGMIGASGNQTPLNGSFPGLMGRLGNILGFTSINHSVDAAANYAMNAMIGFNGLGTGNGPTDLVNADTVILLGFNVSEAAIHYYHFVQDAQDAGAKIIVIDPAFTHAAAQADQYIPCRPGSDPALMLAIIHCILRDGNENRPFLQEKTVAPYLVRSDTEEFLRVSDLPGRDSDPGDPGDSDVEGFPAVVRTTDGTMGHVNAVSNPLMEGRWEVELADGSTVECATAFQLLRERVDEYPPSVGAEISDVPEETIEELAARIVSGPTTIRTGWGSQAFNNGTMAARCVLTLAAVTGYIGQPGADVGSQFEVFLGLNQGFATPTDRRMAPMESIVLGDVLTSGKFKGEEYPLKSLYIYCGNPAGTSVDENQFKREIVDNLDFICTADQVMNETALLSDLVLPAAHFYESEDIIPIPATHPYLQYSERAIDPLFECKPDGTIARMLAKKMGLEEYFNQPDDEYFRELMDSPELRERGITWDDLKEKRAIRIAAEPWIAYGGNQTFNTPNGRMQFYEESPSPRFDYGQKIPVKREQLPSFYSPTEAWPGTQAQKKYPFVVISERSRYHAHSQFTRVPWLKELDAEPILKMSPKDAASRGIADGDHIEVFNDRGHAVAKAVITEGIRPGMLMYPKGWQSRQYKAGSFSEVNSSEIDPMGVNQSFFDATVDMRKWDETVDSITDETLDWSADETLDWPASEAADWPASETLDRTSSRMKEV
ncbi:MAG: molybdopterin-containing oxidoreductase family protein [Ancrocorticia sp.]|uniref:molybdopterin-containing oxidoreductase family protein n=1 Tax=Ancrocorticia sp. TaxID=2593684 RepID=UPI003F91461A